MISYYIISSHQIVVFLNQKVNVSEGQMSEGQSGFELSNISAGWIKIYIIFFRISLENMTLHTDADSQTLITNGRTKPGINFEQKLPSEVTQLATKKQTFLIVRDDRHGEKAHP